jgi:hypothetical protein
MSLSYLKHCLKDVLYVTFHFGITAQLTVEDPTVARTILSHPPPASSNKFEVPEREVGGCVELSGIVFAVVVMFVPLYFVCLLYLVKFVRMFLFVYLKGLCHQENICFKGLYNQYFLFRR